MLSISFKNVGRAKLSWTQNLKSLDEVSLFRAVKKRGALMSNDVDFYWDETDGPGQRGTILAGGRQVGTFEINAVSA